jgi:serpin B
MKVLQVMSGRALIVCLLFVSLFQGCSDDPTGPGGPPPQITALPRPLSVVEQAVIQSSNLFGLGLLQEVDARREIDMPNTVLSPFSASLALGMAMEGADGETYAELRDALGFHGLSREEVTASFGGLMSLFLDLDPDVELGIANSAWSRLGFPFTASYLDALTEHFDAKIQELDFDDPGAKDVINAWVEGKTNGLIDEIVEDILPQDILFLINALYFKGDWTTRFETSQTQTAPFTLSDGSAVDVEMMKGSLPLVGLSWPGDGRLVAELPYGGQAFGMVLALPAPGENLDALLGALDVATWEGWMDGLQQQEVAVRLPRFELDWDGLLNEPLQAMGIQRAFDPYQADFSLMTTVPGVFVTRVRQKTYMKVDEEGTEAAAATSVGIGLTSVPTSVTFDRPFLLAIRERLTGTILFLGAIRDPR